MADRMIATCSKGGDDRGNGLLMLTLARIPYPQSSGQGVR